MEALNAAGLTPISAVLSDRKQEPRKNQTFCQIPHQKSSDLSKRIQGSLVVLSSLLSTTTTGLVAAKALTYEEALQQSVDGGGSSFSGGDFDITGVLDSVVGFASDNPIVVAGGVAVLAVPLVVSQLFKKPKPWGIESARSAYAKLGEDSGAQLVDIRPTVDLRKVGTPDIRGLGKKPVSIVYKGDDKPGFLKKLALKFKDPENTTLFILDKFDGNSELVAELVTVNGFKAAYGIKDGVEGPRGWLNSGLPWAAPRKTASLDFGSLADSLGGVIGDGADGLSVALGIAAATGLGALVFTEAETVLQVLGSAAIVQVVTKKLLFAEDRKKTLKQVDEFLNTKIAPKELVDDVKEIGKALLPTVTSKSLPSPSEVASESPAAPPEPKVETVPETKAEATAEPAKEVSSEPKPRPRYSSPYAAYPDFKPPASPTPSPP